MAFWVLTLGWIEDRTGWHDLMIPLGTICSRLGLRTALGVWGMALYDAYICIFWYGQITAIDEESEGSLNEIQHLFPFRPAFHLGVYANVSFIPSFSALGPYSATLVFLMDCARARLILTTTVGQNL